MSGKFIVKEEVVEVTRHTINNPSQRRVLKSLSTSEKSTRSRPYSQGDPFIEESLKDSSMSKPVPGHVKSHSVTNFKSVSGPVPLKGGCQRVLVKPVGAVKSNSFLLIDRNLVDSSGSGLGSNNLKTLTLVNGISSGIGRGAIGRYSMKEIQAYKMTSTGSMQGKAQHILNNNFVADVTGELNATTNEMNNCPKSSNKCRNLSAVNMEDVVTV